MKKTKKLDAGYSFEQEAGGGRWITRFNGERIGSANTKGQAIDTAYWDQERRANKASSAERVANG